MDKEFLIFQILLKHIRKKKCRHIFKFNVNLRKLSYAVTAEGISELRTRSQNFARCTFELANKYNEKLLALVVQAKKKSSFLATAISSFCSSMPVRHWMLPL